MLVRTEADKIDVSAYNMCGSFLSVNVTLHDAILVDTDRSEKIEGALVTRIDTVKDQADDNLLPSRTALIPELGLLQVDDVADVLHDTVKGSSSENFVFVIIRDSNEKLGVPVVHGWPKVVTVLQGELVRIARRSGIWTCH